MPNHCETDLIVHGPKALVAEVLAKHFTENGELNCTTVIPYPRMFKLLDDEAEKWNEENKNNPNRDWRLQPKDGYNQGGYQWCCENWGTKWGTYNGDGINKTTRGFSTSFSSAWAPPEPVIAKLAEMYPKLRIQQDSYEQGMGYQIHNVWKNGEQIKAESENNYRGGRGG